MTAEPAMTDDEFMHRFETCALSPGRFRHRDHVRLAWIYVTRYPLLEAMARFTRALKRFAAHHGAVDKYHETITWAYLLLVHERANRGSLERVSMTQSSDPDTWQDFADRNGDLMDWGNNVLHRYYRRETLASVAARRMFVFPDRMADS